MAASYKIELFSYWFYNAKQHKNMNILNHVEFTDFYSDIFRSQIIVISRRAFTMEVIIEIINEL